MFALTFALTYSTTNLASFHIVLHSHCISISQSSASASASPAAPTSASAFASASATTTASPVAPALPVTSQAAASTYNASTDVAAPNVGAVLGIGGDLLRPYMGLLPLEQPHDPWTEKAYNPHYALYSGGGSYEPYLPRPRRDTHIMPSPSAAAAAHMLTPGMLERLLRIKNEFQRRFPHLYQGMLNHHTNQTRVVVKPPLLVQLPSSSASSSSSTDNDGNGNRLRLKESEPPVYELGAAERGLFDDEPEPEPEQEEQEQQQEQQQERAASGEAKARDQQKQQRRQDDNVDREVDYFHFDDDEADHVQQQHLYNDNDNDNDTDEPIDD